MSSDKPRKSQHYAIAGLLLFALSRPSVVVADMLAMIELCVQVAPK